MRPEEVLEHLKNIIIDRFSKISYCDVEYDTASLFYIVYHILTCRHPKVNSSIMFASDDLTEWKIEIEFEDLSYEGRIIIPSEELARKHLFEMRICETIEDYLILIRRLMRYSKRDEYVKQVLFMEEDNKLEITIYDNGNIKLNYHYIEDDIIIDSYIEIYKTDKSLKLRVVKLTGEIEDKRISMETVPKAFKSVINYALFISSPDEYLRLEEAIRKLAEFIEVRNYSVGDAIELLVKMYDYGDIFG